MQAADNVYLGRTAFGGRGGGDLITALKYRGRIPLARWLGAALGAAVLDRLDPVPSLVTWAPTTRARQRRRGFDQSRLLAREVGRALDLPARSTLVRLDRDHQTGRPRVERREAGPRFEGRTTIRGSVLLVDDVVTTGATLVSARRALLVAGASDVAAACVSRVAAPSSAGQSGTVAADLSRSVTHGLASGIEEHNQSHSKQGGAVWR